MIIDNNFHRIISNFGYRLRALLFTRSLIFISSRAPNHPLTSPQLFLLSWGLIPCKAIKKEDSLGLHEGLLLPMLLYAIWQVQCPPQLPILLCQVVYLVITEGLLHKAMEEDSSLVTSMR